MESEMFRYWVFDRCLLQGQMCIRVTLPHAEVSPAMINSYIRLVPQFLKLLLHAPCLE